MMIKSLIEDIMAALGARTNLKNICQTVRGASFDAPKIVMKHENLPFSPGDLLDPAS
jgi:hypothetical protein